MQAQRKITMISMCYQLLREESELNIVEVIKEREIGRETKEKFLFVFEIFMKLICRTHLVRD